MSADSLNLTGLWHGTFSYPHSMPPNGFLAELRDFSGHLAGEITERSDWSRNRGQINTALVEGTRSGTTVQFAKRYDDARRAETPIVYMGTLSADGDEITGTWSISRHWSGSFIMVREARRDTDVEATVAETVR